jgi:hypothetical protein
LKAASSNAISIARKPTSSADWQVILWMWPRTSFNFRIATADVLICRPRGKLSWQAASSWLSKRKAVSLCVIYAKPDFEDSKSPACFSLSMDTSAAAKPCAPIPMNFVIVISAVKQRLSQYPPVVYPIRYGSPRLLAHLVSAKDELRHGGISTIHDYQCHRRKLHIKSRETSSNGGSPIHAVAPKNGSRNAPGFQECR